MPNSNKKLSRNTKSKSKKKSPPTCDYPSTQYSRREKKDLHRLHDYYFDALTTKYECANMAGLKQVVDRGSHDEEDFECLWLVLLKNNDSRKLPGLLKLEEDDFSVVCEEETESEDGDDDGDDDAGAGGRAVARKNNKDDDDGSLFDLNRRHLGKDWPKLKD